MFDEQSNRSIPRREGVDRVRSHPPGATRTAQLQVDIHAVAHTLLTDAMSVVPTAERAAILLLHHGQPIGVLAATDEHSRTLSALQRRHRQGPCLEISDENPVARVNDLLRETRWPHLVAPMIAATPTRSLLALEIFADGHLRWILELSTDVPRAFTDDDSRRALSWAGEQQQRLTGAACCRGGVDDAAQLLSRRFALDSQAGFALLVRISDHRRQPFTGVAAALVSHPRHGR